MVTVLILATVRLSILVQVTKSINKITFKCMNKMKNKYFHDNKFSQKIVYAFMLKGLSLKKSKIFVKVKIFELMIFFRL